MNMCHFCFRPAVVTVYLRNGLFRKLFDLPNRKIQTCAHCVTKAAKR